MKGSRLELVLPFPECREFLDKVNMDDEVQVQIGHLSLTATLSEVEALNPNAPGHKAIVALRFRLKETP